MNIRCFILFNHKGYFCYPLSAGIGLYFVNVPAEAGWTSYSWHEMLLSGTAAT